MPSFNRLPRSPAGLVVLLVLLGGAWLISELSDGNGGSTTRPPAGEPVTVKVDRYVDGDTAKVFYEGRSEYVRYIGIDTPETVKQDTPVGCFGRQASDFNRNAVEGRTVRLVFDRELRDHYGRLLAYVYVGDRFLNAEILAGGYGTTIEVPPNTSKAEQFSDIEAKARAEGRGLWGAC